MDVKLPEWPTVEGHTFVDNVSRDFHGELFDTEPYFDETSYERARAEAAIARLRVAVAALEDIARGNPENAFVRSAIEALAQIGLPETEG